MDRPNNSEPRIRHTLRVLRPLGWWLLLVLVLYGIRTHQRLMEQTRLRFSVRLQGETLYSDTTGTLDGLTASSGERLSLGRHTFTVTYPKAETFSTNLFTWYGGHDLGRIDLKRAKGTLSIQSTPAAAWLAIRGPEFTLTLTNSSGTNVSVPTDRYSVEAKYAHWEKAEDVFISSGLPGTVRFAPRFGVMKMTCSHEGASFQLNNAEAKYIESGQFPFVMTGLPEGRYQIVAQHHGHKRQQTVEVAGGATNDVKVEFIYGAASFETDPSGATVLTSDGHDWGVTPLILPELNPGSWKFAVRRDGYEPVRATLEIIANQTNTFRTNLVNTTYLGSIQAARQYLASKDYGQAYEAVVAALRVSPGDSVASALKREAGGLENLRLAKVSGKNGDYGAGLKELTLAIEALPDNEEAKLLLPEFKKLELEQNERRRVERLNSGTNTFKSALREYPDASLFTAYQLNTSKPLLEVRSAIIDALALQPAFKVAVVNTGNQETFELTGHQEFSTYLATIAGRRQCVIVGAQTKDDETQIFFKILEYKTEAVNKFSIGALLNTPVAVNYVAIHPSRVGALTEKFQARIAEGVSNMTARIQGAIGQTPVVQPDVFK